MMKRLVIVLLSLSFLPLDSLAIALIQQATCTGASSPVTCTISAPASGNTLCVMEGASQGSAITSVSGGGVTWVAVSSSTVKFDAEIWCGPNSSGSGTTITINWSVGGTLWANTSEWSGMPTSLTKDGTARNNGTTTNPIATSITTTNASDVMLATVIDPQTLSSGPTNSYTALNTAQANRVQHAYRIVSVTGAYSTDWTYGTSNDWETEHAALQGSGGGAAAAAGVNKRMKRERMEE